MKMPMKTIGILGGMGPEATFELYGKIIRYTPSEKDQDHIPCVIFSNTQVPDRTESILKGDAKAVKVLRDSAKVLEEAGADFIVIPCNTAHHWIKEIQNAVGIPVVDMIEETAKYLKGRRCKRIGLLATTGTIRTCIYEKVLEAYGIEVIKPANQENIMGVIKKVKAGDTSERQREIIEKEMASLKEKGIATFVLGCTELPLVFRKGKRKEIVDPMDVLAATAIGLAGKKPKNIF